MPDSVRVTGVPKGFPPSSSSSVSFSTALVPASDTRKVGVVSLVTSSLLEPPVSLPAVRSMVVVGAPGAVLSRV